MRSMLPFEVVVATVEDVERVLFVWNEIHRLRIVDLRRRNEAHLFFFIVEFV